MGTFRVVSRFFLSVILSFYLYQNLNRELSTDEAEDRNEPAVDS
jgi:hypothetical protein